MQPRADNAEGTGLSATLPGTWQLESRIDRTASGEVRSEPSLGEDPIALLIYDRSGHFAAQFMKRDRSVPVPDGPSGAKNNSRAQAGYDAYFGTYTVDEAKFPAAGRTVRCAKCGHSWHQPGPEPEPAPAAEIAPAPAAPVPEPEAASAAAAMAAPEPAAAPAESEDAFAATASTRTYAPAAQLQEKDRGQGLLTAVR